MLSNSNSVIFQNVQWPRKWKELRRKYGYKYSDDDLSEVYLRGDVRRAVSSDTIEHFDNDIRTIIQLQIW